MERDWEWTENEPLSVEFVGGPYDGFLHVLACPPVDLAADIAVPVSFNLILAAAGQEHGPLLPFRRVASYQLVNKRGDWRYEFTGEIIVEQMSDAG